ncbi:hypothetical protein GGR54DRAFT_605330 [Hypoxylon sp. NC1633]|nr:hypothetical protein GGR54DRAFT_605330 [Hypoxylon sp. NC1633]
MGRRALTMLLPIPRVNLSALSSRIRAKLHNSWLASLGGSTRNTRHGRSISSKRAIWRMTSARIRLRLPCPPTTSTFG